VVVVVERLVVAVVVVGHQIHRGVVGSRRRGSVVVVVVEHLVVAVAVVGHQNHRGVVGSHRRGSVAVVGLVVGHQSFQNLGSVAVVVVGIG